LLSCLVRACGLRGIGVRRGGRSDDRGHHDRWRRRRSLRAAIEAVNTNNGGGPCGALGNGTTTIELPAGHYTLSGGELSIAANANLAIVGADPSETVIDGNKQSRVLAVAAKANATLDGVEVTGGATLHGTDASAPGGVGGVGENGGGILNRGNLTLEHVLVTANMTR
jgi:hypothetical protein